MGLLSRFFGRKPAPAPEPEPEQDLGPDNPRDALAPVVAVLGARDVRVDADGSDVCEVRGQISGRPARVKLDSRPSLDLELKTVQLGLRVVTLIHDASKIPRAADADDPWDEGTVRTFVGKGVYVEGSADDVEGIIGRLDAISGPIRAALFSAMRERFPDHAPVVFCAAGESLSLSGAVAYGSVLQVAEAVLPALAGFASELEQLPDPLAAMLAAAQHGLQPAGGQPAGGQAAPAPTPPPRQVKCEYCRSRFVATWDFACPNCGAPTS